jgi:secreted trypsin-like serine protease
MRGSLLTSAIVAGTAVLGLMASTGTANAIIGGVSADQPYPFMASITVDMGNGAHFHCGGSLITHDVVETNAHCVALKEEPITAAELHVRVGSNSRTAGGTVVGVDQISVNPTWNEDTALGDIALLKLSQPVPYQPIPILPWKPRVGAGVRDLGFGCTVVPDACTLASLPTSVNQLDTHVTSPNQCTTSLIDRKELCSAAGKDGAQDCAGDSGSPQLVRFFGRWWLVGSVSRDGDALPADTGNCLNDTMVSVSTADYLPWIGQTVWQIAGERVAG